MSWLITGMRDSRQGSEDESGACKSIGFVLMTVQTTCALAEPKCWLECASQRQTLNAPLARTGARPWLRRVALWLNGHQHMQSIAR